MAGGGKVGNAYITVTPKLSGDFSAKTAQGGSKDGTSYGGKFSSAAKGAIGAGAVAMGNILSNALTSVASFAGQQFADMFQGAMDFEQLSGGVEKIFDQANISQIMADANSAYKDLNMSANEYLSSINQTGAAFAQTMGDQKGYDTARTGMLAIADYASGTGRSVEELNDKFSLITRSTSSYQSIADQFSGILPATSADFLKQAQAAGILSGKYKSLTDVPIAEYQEAVAKMLEKGVADMGLAGNTAAESATTMSGSLAMLKSSWSNLLSGLLDDNADIGASFDAVLESVGAVISNFAPRIGTLLSRIFTEAPQAIVNAIMNLPSAMLPALQAVFGDEMGQTISDNMGAAFEGVASTISGIVDAVVPIGETLVGFFQATWPVISSIVSNAMSFIGSVVQAVWPVISEIITGAMSTISGIIETVWPQIQDIVLNVMTAIDGFMQTAWPAISNLISSVMAAIQSVISVAWPIIQTVVSTVMSVILSVVQTVWPVISSIISGAVSVISGIINGLSSVIGVVTGIFNSVKSAIESPMETAKGIVSGIIDTIKGFFNFQISWPHIPLPHFNVSGSANPVDWLTSGPPSFSIDWYAKGGIVDGATLIGAGEAGPEMILPQRGGLMTDFAEAVASEASDEMLIRWLSRNLGRIIHDNTPTISRRDFDRMARGAVS